MYTILKNNLTKEVNTQSKDLEDTLISIIEAEPTKKAKKTFFESVKGLFKAA
jgi:hypothetical protein